MSLQFAEQRGIAGFRRVVALKRLHANVAADPDLLKAFIHEARLESHLKHTNVAQTYDLGKVGDTYFIAMQFVAGPTLGQLMKQCSVTVGAIPLTIVLPIVIQICDALDHAHNLCDESGRPFGIIHRDVSPSNVIVSNTGIVKLIDFGIAKAAGSNDYTQTGMIKGKFCYIAPEYLTGRLDARSDLFVFHSYYGPPLTRVFITLEQFAARFPERIVVLTDAEAEQHLAVGVGRRGQFVKIPSGVDLAAVRAEAAGGARVRRELGLSGETPIIGAVARLVPVKGLRYLVAAMPDILRRCPDVHVVLAGDGDQRSALEGLARDLAIADRVHLLGFRRDAVAVTAALNVFVLPSLNEGQGRVLVTAMALGVPIVATKVGGVPEVVEDGRQGLLVPSADPQALGRAVSTLLTDRQCAASLGMGGRDRAGLFSSEVRLKLHAELYRNSAR